MGKKQNKLKKITKIFFGLCLGINGLRKQPKRLSHAGIEITIFRVGMQSVNPSYKTFLQSPQRDDSSLAATALLAKLDRKRRD